MKKAILLLAIMTCLISLNTEAQAYYEIYPIASADVQNKMNENKIAGIDILTDINAHHTIGLSGVNISMKGELETLFNNNSKVHSLVISNDVTSIKLDAEASLTKAEIQQILDEFDGITTGHTIDYSIQQ